MAKRGSKSKPGGWRSQLSERVVNEVDYIIKAFAGQKIQVDGAATPDGGLDYLFAVGQLLVRTEYLGAVVELLREASGQQRGTKKARPAEGFETEPVIEGVVVLQIGGFGLSVPDALDRIDERFGEGIATPNHVFTVAQGPGGEVGVCPATEPMEVYERCGPFPFPPVCTGNSGSGALIYLGDTGLLKHAVADHGWLSGVEPVANSGAVGQGWEAAPKRVGGTLTIPPYTGHGTFVAGVARCMAPEVDIYVADVFKIAGSALESHMVQRLRQALARDDVDIFHLTVAATTRKDIHLIAFEAWLRRLHQHKGVICVAAAGNNGSRRRCWPAAFPEVISVGALATDWRSRAGFSNFGRWVDVYAPGTNLINAYAEGTYLCTVSPFSGTERRFRGLAEWSGTSFSTPIVTGLVAARMSRTGESAREAAASLLRLAQAQAVAGTGPILVPCCGTAPHCDRCCEPRPHTCG